VRCVTRHCPGLAPCVGRTWLVSRASPSRHWPSNIANQRFRLKSNGNGTQPMFQRKQVASPQPNRCFSGNIDRLRTHRPTTPLPRLRLQMPSRFPSIPDKMTKTDNGVTSPMFQRKQVASPQPNQRFSGNRSPTRNPSSTYAG